MNVISGGDILYYVPCPPAPQVEVMSPLSPRELHPWSQVEVTSHKNIAGMGRCTLVNTGFLFTYLGFHARVTWKPWTTHTLPCWQQILFPVWTCVRTYLANFHLWLTNDNSTELAEWHTGLAVVILACRCARVLWPVTVFNWSTFRPLPDRMLNSV